MHLLSFSVSRLSRCKCVFLSLVVTYFGSGGLSSLMLGFLPHLDATTYSRTSDGRWNGATTLVVIMSGSQLTSELEVNGPVHLTAQQNELNCDTHLQHSNPTTQSKPTQHQHNDSSHHPPHLPPRSLNHHTTHPRPSGSPTKPLHLLWLPLPRLSLRTTLFTPPAHQKEYLLKRTHCVN